MKKMALSEIQNVPYYGKHFPFIPWSIISKIKVSLVFAKTLFQTIGLVQFIGFWIFILPANLIQTFQEGRKGFVMMREAFGKMAEIEWILLVVIYKFIENKTGKEFAYQFSKDAIQKASRFMMSDFYQAKKLSEFDDPFEAFWLYHKAMFKDDPNYPNELIDEGDCKIMIVHECKNCIISELTIPELAKLGCDHDITGYQSIEKLTKMEFRRPQTLAKDNKYCKFMFFREGTAPKDIEIK